MVKFCELGPFLADFHKYVKKSYPIGTIYAHSYELSYTFSENLSKHQIQYIC